jgi:hypothetical protein
MGCVRNDLFRSKAEDMNERNDQHAGAIDLGTLSLSVDEEELPGLLEEKRRREELSRQIAFGEGL